MRLFALFSMRLLNQRVSHYAHEVAVCTETVEGKEGKDGCTIDRSVDAGLLLSLIPVRSLQRRRERGDVKKDASVRVRMFCH